MISHELLQYAELRSFERQGIGSNLWKDAVLGWKFDSLGGTTSPNQSSFRDLWYHDKLMHLPEVIEGFRRLDERYKPRYTQTNSYLSESATLLRQSAEAWFSSTPLTLDPIRPFRLNNLALDHDATRLLTELERYMTNRLLLDRPGFLTSADILTVLREITRITDTELSKYTNAIRLIGKGLGNHYDILKVDRYLGYHIAHPFPPRTSPTTPSG